MKVAEFKKSLEKMNMQQLQETLEKLQRELFSLRLSAATAHVKNYALFKQYRRNIARVMTLMGRQSTITEGE